jgi:glycosyltransferase involved in cell wall biosynthesis
MVKQHLPAVELPQVVSQIIGRWDDFNFLRAFHDMDCLRGFATDFKWSSNIVNEKLQRFLPVSMAGPLSRCGSPHLPARIAHVDPLSFVYMLLLKAGISGQRRRTEYSKQQGQAVGIATKNLARRLNAGAVFSYSYYAGWTFDDLEPQFLRLLHQVHPYAPALKKIYEQEMSRGSLLSEHLRDELEIGGDRDFYDKLTSGARMAQHIVVASEFTKQTLISEGILPERISIIPYGTDLGHFSLGPGTGSGKMKVLFVGSISARKGIGYLLEAWRLLNPQSAELIIVGQVPNNREIHDALSRSGATVLGRVDQQRLLELFQSASLFCLPSIAEGFGLVFLQALACGTPILGTEATGAADITRRDPEVGFLVKAASVESLATGLEKALSMQHTLTQLRPLCSMVANHYTWTDFRQNVQDWYKGIYNLQPNR